MMKTMTHRHWPRMLFRIGLWLTIALAGFGAAVWQLWNLLMPELFGLRPIGYWQACGLMGLCWLLFGGWRWPGASGRRARHRALSDDERRLLRDRLAAGQPAGPV